MKAFTICPPCMGPELYQHHFVIVLQQTSPYFRNQEANQVNIRTVRTKTSGSNNIKSKSVNIWKFLQIFINRLFYNGLCLAVPLLFIIYLFFFCVWFLSVLLLLASMYLMVLSCIGGQAGLASWLTDCLPSNCIKKYFWRIHTYLLTYLLKKHHHTQTFLISCGKSFLGRDLPKIQMATRKYTHNTEIECTLPL